MRAKTRENRNPITILRLISLVNKGKLANTLDKLRLNIMHYNSKSSLRKINDVAKCDAIHSLKLSLGERIEKLLGKTISISPNFIER